METRYFKLFHNKDWCIFSFKSNQSDTVAKSMVFTLTRFDVMLAPLTFDDYLNYDLKRFAVFQYGPLKFEVGSRDPIRFSDFFKKEFCKRLANVYHLYPTVNVPSSSV